MDIQVQESPLTTCNYCGCRKANIIAEWARFEKHNVLKCQNCDLVYLEMQESKEDIEAYYASEYRKITTLPMLPPEVFYHTPIVKYDAIDHTTFIKSNVNIVGKRILEVGSATGALLEKLSEGGCKEVVGIELGKSYAEYAQNRGYTVFTRPIEELALCNEFDVVVSFMTIEHVYDPMQTIQAIRKALKPGGCFIGEVPNQLDWRLQIFNDEVSRRFHYDPNHYYYFTPSSLVMYLNACDFLNVELDTVERYNSLVQLRNILGGYGSEDIEDILKKYIFNGQIRDAVVIPDTNDSVMTRFNRIFEKGVNSESMGNCLRWVAR